MRLKKRNFAILIMCCVILMLIATNIYTKYLLAETIKEHDAIRITTSKDDAKLIIGAYKYGPKEIE